MKKCDLKEGMFVKLGSDPNLYEVRNNGNLLYFMNSQATWNVQYWQEDLTYKTAFSNCEYNARYTVTEIYDNCGKLLWERYPSNTTKDICEYPIPKVGQVVEYRNGQKALVLPSKKGEYYLTNLSEFNNKPNEDLTYKGIALDNTWDIIRIYESTTDIALNTLLKADTNRFMKCIWERKEKVKLTKSQIAEKFCLKEDEIEIV